MKILIAFAGLLLFSAPSVQAAPATGSIVFGRHFDFQRLDVYPTSRHFEEGVAPLYAATFWHPVHAMHVTVALSSIFGASTELVALDHDYMDYGTTGVMGWLPKETLTPGLYVLTIRGHNTVLASGSFRVVKAHSVRPGKH